MSTGSEPANQQTVSRSWLLTSASMPLDVRMSLAQAGGSPGPCVSDLMIIGEPSPPPGELFRGRHEVDVEAAHEAQLHRTARRLRGRA